MKKSRQREPSLLFLAGWAVTGGKYINKGAKLIKSADDITDAAKVVRNAEKAVDALEGAGKANKTIQKVINGGQVSGKDMIKALEREGFKIERQTGSHVQLKGPNGENVTVPSHSNNDLPKGTLNSILKQAGYK